MVTLADHKFCNTFAISTEVSGHTDLNQSQSVVDPLAYSNVLHDTNIKLLVCDNSRVSTPLTRI